MGGVGQAYKLEPPHAEYAASRGRLIESNFQPVENFCDATSKAGLELFPGW